VGRGAGVWISVAFGGLQRVGPVYIGKRGESTRVQFGVGRLGVRGGGQDQNAPCFVYPDDREESEEFGLGWERMARGGGGGAGARWEGQWVEYPGYDCTGTLVWWSLSRVGAYWWGRAGTGLVGIISTRGMWGRVWSLVWES
jgi:hypothetical protein